MKIRVKDKTFESKVVFGYKNLAEIYEKKKKDVRQEEELSAYQSARRNTGLLHHTHTISNVSDFLKHSTSGFGIGGRERVIGRF